MPGGRHFASFPTELALSRDLPDFCSIGAVVELGAEFNTAKQ